MTNAQTARRVASAALPVILMGASGDLKDLASNVRAFSNR